MGRFIFKKKQNLVPIVSPLSVGGLQGRGLEGKTWKPVVAVSGVFMVPVLE